jgi:hypothetical protein
MSAMLCSCCAREHKTDKCCTLGCGVMTCKCGSARVAAHATTALANHALGGLLRLADLTASFKLTLRSDNNAPSTKSVD